MKLHDDYYEEEHGSGSKMPYVYMVLIMSVVILGVTALVFWANEAKRSDGSGYAAALAQKEAQAVEAKKQMDASASENAVIESRLTSDDLDIWTLPDTGREKKDSKPAQGNGTVTNQTTGETVTDGTGEPSDDTDPAKTADELANGKTSVYDVTDKENMKDDGSSGQDQASTEEATDDEEEEDEEEEEEIQRIQVKHSDGTKEWIDVNKDIPRNKYDLSNLKYDKARMDYYVDGEVVSKCGVDVSAALGDVDFAKLKKAGYDFAMIKVGARGYSSGRIVMDVDYQDNIESARKAGLDVGVYFCSQAINKSEARDEADELLGAISGYRVKYPVVFVMENIVGDMARIESLDVADRTQIAKEFLTRIRDAGYTPMIYGDKEWLLTMVDMEALQDFDVWFAQDGDRPEYPYEFGMWQYDSDAKVKGISGNAALTISFKDYAK